MKNKINHINISLFLLTCLLLSSVSLFSQEVNDNEEITVVALTSPLFRMRLRSIFPHGFRTRSWKNRSLTMSLLKKHFHFRRNLNPSFLPGLRAKAFRNFIKITYGLVLETTEHPTSSFLPINSAQRKMHLAFTSNIFHIRVRSKISLIPATAIPALIFMVKNS